MPCSFRSCRSHPAPLGRVAFFLACYSPVVSPCAGRHLSVALPRVSSFPELCQQWQGASLATVVPVLPRSHSFHLPPLYSFFFKTPPCASGALASCLCSPVPSSCRCLHTLADLFLCLSLSQADLALKQLKALNSPMIEQIIPLFEQLPPLYNDLASGKDEFIPSPDETRNLVRSIGSTVSLCVTMFLCYRVPARRLCHRSL